MGGLGGISVSQFAYNFAWIAWDYNAGTVASDRTDGVLEGPDGQIVPTFDENDAPAPLRTGASGVVRPFRADVVRGVARFGEARAVVISDDGFESHEAALAAAAEAAATRAAVEQFAENASEVAYFYRDAQGDIWVSGDPVLVGGGVPRLDANGDPVVVFSSLI